MTSLKYGQSVCHQSETVNNTSLSGARAIMMQHNDLQSGHRNANSNSFLPLFHDDNIIKARHTLLLQESSQNMGFILGITVLFSEY